MPRVLIIDDDPAIGTLLGEALRRKGWEPVVTQEGSRGLAVLARPEKVDLILLDLAMPRMNGREFLIELEKNRQHRSIPVVLVTGEAYESTVWPPASRYCAVVKKPFKLGELWETVRMVSGPHPPTTIIMD